MKFTGNLTFVPDGPFMTGVCEGNGSKMDLYHKLGFHRRSYVCSCRGIYKGEGKISWKYDPFNLAITAFLGSMYTYMGRHEDAIRQAHRTFDILPDFPLAYFVLGEAYLAMGEHEKAIEAHQKLAELAPPWGWFLGYTYALTGHQEKAEAILKELEATEPSGWNAMAMAVICGALDRFDEAFKFIKYEPHHVWIPWIAVMPMWKPLYKDPRHAEFVKNLNLPLA